MVQNAACCVSEIDGFQLCIMLEQAMKLKSSRKMRVIPIPQITECPGAALFCSVGADVGEDICQSFLRKNLCMTAESPHWHFMFLRYSSR